MRKPKKIATNNPREIFNPRKNPQRVYTIFSATRSGRFLRRNSVENRVRNNGKNLEGIPEIILGGNSGRIPEAKTPEFLDTISG